MPGGSVTLTVVGCYTVAGARCIHTYTPTPITANKIITATAQPLESAWTTVFSTGAGLGLLTIVVMRLSILKPNEHIMKVLHRKESRPEDGIFERIGE